MDYAQAWALLAELRAWALAHSVIVADLRSTNLMLRHRAGRDELVFVDGLGGRRLDRKFTLNCRFTLLARLKTRRQWRRQKARTLRALQELHDARYAR